MQEAGEYYTKCNNPGKERKILRPHLFGESKKVNFIETESRMVVARDLGLGENWETTKGHKKSHKMNIFWGSNVQNSVMDVLINVIVIIIIQYISDHLIVP